VQGERGAGEGEMVRERGPMSFGMGLGREMRERRLSIFWVVVKARLVRETYSSSRCRLRGEGVNTLPQLFP